MRRGGAKRPAVKRNRGDTLTAPAGYVRSGSLLVPATTPAPLSPNKLRKGLAEAKTQLDAAMDEILRTLTGRYAIKEIKLTASFSADGKFMGFGVGGAASMEITICPSDED